MSFIGRIKNSMINRYMKITAKKRKRLFEIGNKSIYQYESEIFCSNMDALLRVKDKYSGKITNYWSEQADYSLKEYFPERYENARKLIYDSFMTLLPDMPMLMDIGCAAGQWTLMVAPKCSVIDGFEYSERLVESAKQNGKDTPNANFYQADAKEMQLEKKYDGAMILGMLMYIENLDDIYMILKNVYDHLKPGAYMCTRDTLNNENKEVVYLFNKVNGYSSVYWSKEAYYEQFTRAGFVLKEEIKLEEVDTRYMSFIGMGDIWQKPLE